MTTPASPSTPSTLPPASISASAPSPAGVPATSPAWPPTARRTVALLALAVIVFFVLEITETLPMLVIAGVLAFLFYPLMRRLERLLGGRRSIAILLTFLIVILLLILVVLIIVPSLVEQVVDFARTVPERLGGIQQSLEATLSQPLVIAGQTIQLEGRPLIPLEQLEIVFGQPVEGDATGGMGDLLGTIQSAAASVSSGVFRFVGGAFTALINGFLLIVIIFYLLKDSHHFADSIVGLVPPSHRDDARRLMALLRDVWNAYLRGQIALCLIIGVIVFITASVLGVPNPLILGLLSGLLEFVPTIGPLIALIPAALLAAASTSSTLPFLSGVPFALTVIVVWTLIQNIESLVIVPRVMGDSLDLHPVVVIVGVLLGAAVAGPLGVILAAPAMASIRVIGQYVYGKLTDTPPFPPPQETNAPAPGLGEAVRQQFAKFVAFFRPGNRRTRPVNQPVEPERGRAKGRIRARER